jgi:uncharacterized protein YkwD
MRCGASRIAVVLVAAAALTFGAACSDDEDDQGSSGTGVCDETGEGYWESDWAALECEVLDLVNEVRASGAECGDQGQFGSTEPLVMQHQLREAARYHSQWMGETGNFTHDSPGGPNGDTWIDRIVNAGYSDYVTIGENIAAGSASAQDVMDQWMGSPPHCANIMSPEFEDVGIGYAEVAGSGYVHYWTMDLGAR